MNAKSFFIFSGGLVAGLILGVGLSGLFSGPATVSRAPAPVTPGPTPGPNRLKLQQDIQRLEEIVRNDPGNYQAWVQMGNDYFDIDQPQESIDAYRKALALNDKDPNVWTDMGIMYRRLVDYKQALECFRTAVSLDPSHSPSRLNMGVVYVHDLKDFEKGIQAWEDFLAVEPIGARADDIRKRVESLKKMVALQKGAGMPAESAPALPESK